jgi:hypothetical protein
VEETETTANEDVHRPTCKKKHKMMMITAVPGALSLRWETQQQQLFFFKFISVAAAPKIQQNVKLCKFYANFWLENF